MGVCESVAVLPEVGEGCVGVDGFVGDVYFCVVGRVVDVYPVGFVWGIFVGFNDGVSGDVKGVWVFSR